MRRAVAAVSLGLALAACGGGEAPAPDPRADYLAALGQQCVNARLDRDTIEPPGGRRAADLAEYLAANARVAERYQRQAERLRPPSALAARHRRARAIGQEAIGLLRGAAQRAGRGADPDLVLRRLEGPLDRRLEAGNAIATSIGLPQCRQEPLDLREG